MEHMKKRILALVIEDEEAISRALKDWMVQSQDGFDVVIAADGGEALEKVSAEHFDLILLDLVMPKMDGWQFLEALKEKKIDTKIIILTNLESDEDKARARGFDITDYFVKDETTLAMLEGRIREVVGGADRE